MSWKTAAAVLIVIFAIAVVQSVMAGPIVQITGDLNATGDYDNEHFNGNEVISDMPGHWFNMGLIGMFGIMTWGIARVVRREFTRRGG